MISLCGVSSEMVMASHDPSAAVENRQLWNILILLRRTYSPKGRRVSGGISIRRGEPMRAETLQITGNRGSGERYLGQDFRGQPSRVSGKMGNGAPGYRLAGRRAVWDRGQEGK